MTLLMPRKSYKNQMTSTWEDVFESFFSERPVMRISDYNPSLNVTADDNKIMISAELPGMKKEEISIDFQDGILTVSGEKKQVKKEEKSHIVREEIRYGSFSRSVRVGHVDFNKAEARYEDGVLTISLPKAEEMKTNRLQIK